VDIAWPALVSLVILMPGVFFFVGLYSRELYGRDASSRDAVSKLAPIVVVAFFTNAFLVLVARILPGVPEIDLRAVLSAMSAGAEGAVGISALAENLRRDVVWIAMYEAAACALGALAGFVMAGLVISGRWKVGVAHPWAYALTADSPKRLNPTYAFVLTKVKRGNAFELYRGPLDRFGLTPDGRFSHIVLLQPEKCKVDRDADGVTAGFRWSEVGESTGEAVQQRLLYIEMANVANVVFEKYPAIVDVTAKELADLLETLRQERAVAAAPDRASEPPAYSGRLDPSLGRVPDRPPPVA